MRFVRLLLLLALSGAAAGQSIAGPSTTHGIAPYDNSLSFLGPNIYSCCGYPGYYLDRVTVSTGVFASDFTTNVGFSWLAADDQKIYGFAPGSKGAGSHSTALKEMVRYDGVTGVAEVTGPVNAAIPANSWTAQWMHACDLNGTKLLTFTSMPNTGHDRIDYWLYNRETLAPIANYNLCGDGTTCATDLSTYGGAVLTCGEEWAFERTMSVYTVRHLTFDASSISSVATYDVSAQISSGASALLWYDASDKTLVFVDNNYLRKWSTVSHTVTLSVETAAIPVNWINEKRLGPVNGKFLWAAGSSNVLELRNLSNLQVASNLDLSTFSAELGWDSSTEPDVWAFDGCFAWVSSADYQLYRIDLGLTGCAVPTPPRTLSQPAVLNCIPAILPRSKPRVFVNES